VESKGRSAVDTLPYHLRGNFAPVMEEVTGFDLPVKGAIPPELCGIFVRNGPNPKSGFSPHWFAGDGMLHGVALRDGRAVWYKNRWVRTRSFSENARYVRDDGSRDVSVGNANTNIVAHAGRILALVETSLPMQVTSELETVGCFDFDGRLSTAMTAHPKICPRTGELLFFAYNWQGRPPWLIYYRADAAGNLKQSEIIDVPGPTLMHDFAITEHHVVFMDLPVVFDLKLAMAGKLPFRWSDAYGARLGVMPRAGGKNDVRWYEIAPCYVAHTFNAYEDENGGIVIDVVRFADILRGSSDWQEAPWDASSLHRWRIDLAAGRVSEQQIDDRLIEFPRMDDRRMGQPHRFGYAVYAPRGGNPATGSAIVKYNFRSGAAEVHDFGEGRIPSEPVFAPAGSNAAEDEGWLMTYVYDEARQGSDFVIMNARDVSGEPVATITLPQRVPFGFHGNWFGSV
jgi:carotenoid cleavage dioxygenase